MTETLQWDAPGSGSWDGDRTYKLTSYTRPMQELSAPGFEGGFAEVASRYGLPGAQGELGGVGDDVAVRPRAERLAISSARIASTLPSAVLAIPLARPLSPCGLDRVGRVALAVLASRLAVRAVNLDHLHTAAAEEPSQARAIGAGPLHANPVQRPEPDQPVVQLLEAGGGGGGERLDAEDAAVGVKRGGDVGVEVGVAPPVTVGNLGVRCSGLQVESAPDRCSARRASWSVQRGTSLVH